MLKLLAALLLIINPLTGIFHDKILFDNNDASSSETPLFTPSNNPDPSYSSDPIMYNGQFFKLPMQEDAFLDSRQLPAYPMRNWNIEEPDIPAKIALVIDTSHHQILYQKNGIYDQHPIASLTKLMTALVTIDNVPLDSIIKISPTAVATESEMGNLRIGEELTIKTLLYALLVNSSNDAAVALAENIPKSSSESEQASLTNTTSAFIELMNKKSDQLELTNTFFADPSGLTPENYSCAWDIAKMLQEAALNPVLREIMQTQTIDLRSVDGKFNHHLISTNKLLETIPGIIGGKTGYTEEAGNCMALAAYTPENKEMILTVVMDAQDRLAETKTLLKWTKEGFIW